VPSDALVVGAGPAGLVAANLLARYGADVRVIDQDPGPTSQSRATIVHIRTLELLARLGLSGAALARGVRLTGVRLLTAGRHVADIPLAPDRGLEATPFPYALALEQGVTQRLLLESLAAHGRKVEWGTSLVRLTQTDDEAEAVVRAPDGGEETITASWVVGADGARSTVRRALGIGFAGGTYEQTAFLADVAMRAPPDPGFMRLNLVRGGFVGVLPLGGGERHRLFGALTAELAAKLGVGVDTTVGLEDLQAWFDRSFFLDTELTQVHWTALYRTHRRMADRFRLGRCFLIGDAAHIHSPAGGQGLNLGMGDGYNLGWKLGAVVRGEARTELLDSYEAERAASARAVVNGSDRGFEAEASPNRLMQQFRLHVLPVLLRLLSRTGVTRTLLSKLFSQTWIAYRRSPAVAGADQRRRRPHGGPRPGDRAPHGWLELPAAGRTSLYDLLGGIDHHVLLFEGSPEPGGGSPAGEAERGAVDRADQPHGALDRVARVLVDLLARYRMDMRVLWVPRGERALHERYRARGPRVVLIRPDGHIGWQGPADRVQELGAYLDRWYLAGGGPSA
jgi:2-polyprenyl-6-methoxyphenol hydroxylase-like FAD-dependent oxidoreductase